MELEEQQLGMGDYLAILKRRKKLMIYSSVAIFTVVAIIALLLPATYRSEATILIEQQEVPPELVRSTVTSYAGERIQVISQRVMTIANLGKVIEQYDLYPDERKRSSLATVIEEEMKEQISLEMISADVVDPRSGRPTSATIAFKLAFIHRDPRIAQKVTNDLVSLFLDENLKQRTRSAVETSSFLKDEAEKLKDEVAKLDAALAQFKERNINSLPEMQQLNVQLMEKGEREVKDIDQNIRSLEERVIYLRSELAQINPSSSLYSGDGTRVLSAHDRLKALQTQYITLSSRYVETHPDLVKMTKEIEALKKETGSYGDVNELQRKLSELEADLAEITEQYSSEHPDVKEAQRGVDKAKEALQKAIIEAEERGKKVSSIVSKEADNPAFIQLQAQLHAAESEMASFKRLRDQVKKKIDEFEQRLIKSPQVERAFKELARDYENATLKFREVRNKQLEAELATSLERENKGERFSLIEPPLLPEKPASPNRPAIVLLGLLLGLAGGVGLIAIRENLSDAIRSPQELAYLAKAAPLIVMPYIETADEKANGRALVQKGAVAVVASGLLVVVAFHYVVMPLDVLWYVGMRKLGLSE